jgi:ubiquinone/menaquinone biosynthesis C-methylase UbiE
MISQPNEYYENNYDFVLNQGLLGHFKNLTHRFMEKNFPASMSIEKILEVGAGSGFHKKFVKVQYKKYIETDLRAQKNSEIAIADAEDLSGFAANEFERVIATCVLAHLNNPSEALLEWRRVTKNRGTISIYVPCEPGFLLRVFRFFTTNIKARMLSADHYTFHYCEHRNYLINLKYLIKITFPDDQIKVRKFPFFCFTWNFNFFYIYEIRISK